MKFLLISLAALATACLFIFCKSTKYTADKLPAKQLRWGSGGGYVGKETSYTLLENGQIFKFSGITSTTEELGGTKSRTAKNMFSSTDKLALKNVKLDAPGNLFYFLEIKDDSSSHRITWGREGQPVEQKIKDFYAVLQQLVAEKK